MEFYWKILLNKCVVEAQTFQKFIFLLDVAGISSNLVLKHTAAAEKKENWVPVKRWTSEAAKIVHTSGAGFGSARNVLKTSSLLVAKMKQFLHLQPTYTEFTLVTRKLKKMKAFSRFKNENLVFGSSIRW